jgi:hypothetical protein
MVDGHAASMSYVSNRASMERTKSRNCGGVVST